MNKELIVKDETGTYMKIPKDKIKFVSKEAEIMFDIVMENDYLQLENLKLKEKFRATNKGLQKVLLRSKKWKHRYELAKHEIKELKRQNEFLMKRDNKCQILEQQYCERTDCSGRLGTSKKVEALEKENEELKKQLEECIATNEVLSHELTKDKILKQDYLITCCGIPIGDIPKLINQQKVFIEYLEDEIKLYENYIRNFSKDYKVYFSLINDLRVSRTKTEEILQKYKEIVNGTEQD